MGRHGARQQKKLAKKKAKRQDKHNRISRLTSNDPTIRLERADQWKIRDVLVPPDLWTKGLGQLIFSRTCPDGKIACAVFLVDVFCLGIKNCFWKIMTAGDYANLLDKIQEVQSSDSKKVTPEYFSKLVHCAADYAQSLGFAPHADFRHARLLLNGVDPSTCADEIYFGMNGKPFYIRGPHESPDKVRWISQRVAEIGGTVSIDLRETIDDLVGEGELSAEHAGLLDHEFEDVDDSADDFDEDDSDDDLR